MERVLTRSCQLTVKTLTDASVRNCLGDIRELQPTIMVGVPAVWETIRKGIVSKVRSAGALKSKVFDLGVSMKRLGGRGSILGGIADKVVFEAVKQGTGGKLKYALSGGAPISKETQEFLSIALVLIIQGCVPNDRAVVSVNGTCSALTSGVLSVRTATA